MQELARELAEVRQRPVAVTMPQGISPRDVEEAFRALRESAAPAGNGHGEFTAGSGI
jgi:hypothetical protein